MAVETGQKVGNPDSVTAPYTQGTTPQDRARDLRTQQEINKEIKELKALVEQFEKAHPNVKINNHLESLSSAPSKVEAHAALAKTFASYLKEYYTAHWKKEGLTDEQITEGLKNLKIKLSNEAYEDANGKDKYTAEELKALGVEKHTIEEDGKKKDVFLVTRSLLKPDGSVQDDPEVLIGKATRDASGRILKYDVDGGDSGSDGRLLTHKDGLLTLLTWNNERVRDVRNSCLGQLSLEFPRYLRDFPKDTTPPPVKTETPAIAPETPLHVARVIGLRPGRDSKGVSVTLDEKGCPLPEGLVVNARTPQKRSGGLLGAVFGGGSTGIVCPPCPPVLPGIAN